MVSPTEWPVAFRLACCHVQTLHENLHTFRKCFPSILSSLRLKMLSVHSIVTNAVGLPTAALQDDLVCLPQKAAAALGGFGPLALCTRVSNTLTLTDPQTLRQVQMDVSPFSCTWLYASGKPPLRAGRTNPCCMLIQPCETISRLCVHGVLKLNYAGSLCRPTSIGGSLLSLS